MKSVNVDCSTLDQYFGEEVVIFLNRSITEPSSLREDIGGDSFLESVEGFVDSVEASERSELEVSRDEDHFAVINPGVLGNLVQNQLGYECSENNDLIHLASKIMQVIASHQIFGEGNKRTAYLSGCLFLIDYQKTELGLEKVVIPVLNDDLVELLSDVSVDSKDESDIEDYLSDIRSQILEKI